MLECPNCRRRFRLSTRFCGSCGTSLADAAPAVVDPNHGPMEPLASGQNAPGFQAKDNADDTLMRKMPDGFSWHLQRTHLSDKEPQQATDLTSVSVEEVIISKVKPALQSNDSIMPIIPITPVVPPSSASPVEHAVHVSSGDSVVPSLVASSSSANSAPSATSGLAAISSTPGGTVRPAKAPGDHMPFAIPVRPGRSPSSSVAPGPAVEARDEVTAPIPLTHERIMEMPGNLTVVGTPGDRGESLIDYDAFASTMNEAPARSPISPAFLPVGSIARPFDQTFISADLLADIEALSPSPSASTRAIKPAPMVEVSAEESALSGMTVEVVSSAIPTTPATLAESPVPTTPLTAEESMKAEELAEVDVVDESVIPTAPATSVRTTGSEEVGINPEAFFAPFLKPAEVPVHLLESADPYLHLKRVLAEQRVEITAAMDELLPLVYDNHREENQALFASILTNQPSLDDEAWGHAAFVLGAYGNYMYRNQLDFMKKLEIWRAQLWAVYYERSYRRKYLAQRCQQLIHFFQGCAENPTFLVIALHDLETLHLYLEPGSLRKLQQMLQALPVAPADLLQRIEAQMVVAENEKAERMAKQPAPLQPKNPLSVQPLQKSTKKPASPIQQSANEPPQQGAHKLPTQAGQHNPKNPVPQPNANKSASQPARQHAQEEQAFAMPSGGRKWLGFLSDEQRHQFFASLRADRLETINQLLRQEREQILMALREELLNAGPLEYQRPRKSVPVRLGNRGNVNADSFAEAFRLLSSTKLKEQQAALHMFEQNMEGDIGQENKQGAREWMLYARMLIHGRTRVVPDWERAFRGKEASWEEIWNLAYYHRVAGDQAEAARILAPGLSELAAPVSHLRLALICSLTLLLEQDKVEPATQQNARNLLVNHLERWPHPLSCLAWLVLAYETPGTLRPLDQSRRLSAFQALLEYPVDLPDPRSNLTEVQINALEDVLVYKTHCDEAWFLWLNDYALRRPHTYLAWQRLADTSERLGRLTRAETALRHMAEVYYDLDYVYAQDGDDEAPATEELRGYVEKLFAFYRRHEMQHQAWDAFESCYSTLHHLGFWNEQEPANRKLLALVDPFPAELRRQEAVQRFADMQDAKSRSEIRRREVSNNPTRPLEHFKSGQRVGIFVDYENIAHFIPQTEDMESVGQALVGYAAQFGEVICRWASASPRNLSNLAAVRAGLEAAQFKIRYPQRELQFSASRKDLADYALLECISNASLADRLDVYLVVSGDRDYYERIYSLLESGRTVRILACDANLSNTYRDLEQQRQRKHKIAGDEESDFFIDDLDEVLHLLPSSSH